VKSRIKPGVVNTEMEKGISTFPTVSLHKRTRIACRYPSATVSKYLPTLTGTLLTLATLTLHFKKNDL